MDEIRREDLFRFWNSENDDPESQEWREELTAEELDYVHQLDGAYCSGVQRLASTILIREAVRDRFGPGMIQELIEVGERWRLLLRDGSAYLARLAADNTVALSPIDMTC